MRLFESDNIWKRRKRAQARANAPDTPERRREEARQAMTSQFLWLFGAVLLDVLGLVGLKLGVIAPTWSPWAFSSCWPPTPSSPSGRPWRPTGTGRASSDPKAARAFRRGRLFVVFRLRLGAKLV